MSILEGHTYAISPILGRRFADHAYVYCSDKDMYFDCFGKHEGPEPRQLICAGYGLYEVANCYRECPVEIKGSGFFTHDNACLGIYGINGVCHQAANRFLYTAGVTLNNNVQGYWFSVLMYGVYGKDYYNWLNTVHDCFTKKAVELTERKDNDPLFGKVRQLHKLFSAQGTKPHPHEMILKEAAVVTNHYAPEVNTTQYEDLHVQLLRDIDAAIASGLKGKDLGIKINELSTKFQDKVGKIIGAKAYEKLTGIKYGETINIVNLDWM
jgi:hypothetical protein